MLTSVDIFRKGGPLEQELDDYVERAEQLEFAVSIEQAINNNESLICEAGTGTGKTFAYLVPAILSGKKVIVSTGTKNLQDQLFQKDVPIIMKALGIPVNIALLKGRNNYLCRQRLHEYERNFTFLSPEDHSILMLINDWLTRTNTGDLGELLDLPDQSQLKPVITSTSENCLGQECEFYDDCFVLKARRGAQEAGLVVANHHLLMADLSLKETGFGEILPKADIIIFDEAHQLPELAATFFGITLSSRQFYDLLKDCHSVFATDARDVNGTAELIGSVYQDMQQLRRVFGRNDSRKPWSEFSGNRDVNSAISKLNGTLSSLVNLLDKLSIRSRILENCWQRTAAFLEIFNNYCKRETEDQIQWIETRGDGFMLHQTPLDISHIYQERINQHDCLCVYTSATLAVDSDFSHFSTQLGLADCRMKCLPSSFDYEKQSLLYLPAGLPEPAEPGYTAAVVDIALSVIRASKGRTFVLFTSHRALREAAEFMRNEIDYPLLVQGDVPRTELLVNFRTTGHAVLLGTGSFWEGVDVKGESLSSVIIDKLPFMSPDDPVFSARAERMQAGGMNPFLEYQLPRGIISLKQGIGRLIRDDNDCGVLTVCDPRIMTKSYGRKILRSLPAMEITRNISDVERFYSSR